MTNKQKDHNIQMVKLINKFILFVVIPVIGLQVPAFGQ